MGFDDTIFDLKSRYERHTSRDKILEGFESWDEYIEHYELETCLEGIHREVYEKLLFLEDPYLVRIVLGCYFNRINFCIAYNQYLNPFDKKELTKYRTILNFSRSLLIVYEGSDVQIARDLIDKMYKIANDEKYSEKTYGDRVLERWTMGV